MKKISFAIMGHPSRKEHFQYLKDKLGEDTPLFIDTDSKGIWWNAKRAWLAYDPDAEYHCVIQDDIIISDNFHERLAKYLEQSSDVVFNLYMGKRSRFRAQINEAKANKKDRLVLRNLHHECAWLIKTSRIKEMIEYAETFNPDTDRYLNKYIQDRHMLVHFTMPSLVDHRDNESLHDLNRGRYPNGAAYYIS